MKNYYNPNFKLLLILFLSFFAQFAVAQNFQLILNNGFQTSNGSAPQGHQRWTRTCFIITAAEMAASGATASQMFNYCRFNQNVPAAFGASGTVNIYMQNTSDATYLKGLTWSTLLGGMTQVTSIPLTLPTTAGVYTVNYNMPPFTYSGGAMYVAVEYSNPTGALAATLSNHLVSTVLVGGVNAAARAQTNVNTPPATLGTISSRPDLAMGFQFSDDVAVSNIYTLGKFPIEFGSPTTITARVANVGTNPMSNISVSCNISGTNNVALGTVVVPSLASGAGQVVTFPIYTPTSLSTGDIVTVTATTPGDLGAANNTLTWSQNVTQNVYTYKNAAQPNNGGVGFNGGTGDFVAKFNSNMGVTPPYNINPQINEIKVDLFATATPAQTYQVGIWDATGLGGTPGTNLWTSPILTQVAGTAFIPVPNITVVGDYFVGVRQTGTVNVSFAYQAENPIRTGTFYYTAPSGGTTWTDFAATNSAFRFSIEVQVRIPVPPNCAINQLPSDLSQLACVNPTLTWAGGGGAPTGYDVYVGDILADVANYDPIVQVASNQAGTSFTTTGLLPNTTYYWVVVPRNSDGPAIGCTPLSFTTGTLPICYCIPTYTGVICDGGMSAVSINTLSNTSVCAPPAHATFNPVGALTTSLGQSGIYPISVTTTGADIISVWIDYNQDGNFDATEWTQVDIASVANTPSVANITIPGTALLGNTLMRVRSRFSGNPNGSTDACINFGSGSSEDYVVTIIPPVPCSGTPTPGNTIASASSVCVGDTVNFSLQTPISGVGVTYQWGNNGGAIAGATNSTYSQVVTVADDFYCDVTCGANTGTSTLVSISINPFTDCYCFSGADFINDEEIYNVTVNGSSTNPLYANANGCTTIAPGAGSFLNSYSNFKPLGSLTTVNQGAIVPFNIAVDECDGPLYYAFGTAIWIDFNHNGSFADAGEQVFVEAASAFAPRNITGNFTIPLTAMTGQTVMRITAAEGFAGIALTPCLSYGYGETEDYLINIACTQPITLDIITFPNSVCGSGPIIPCTGGLTINPSPLNPSLSGVIMPGNISFNSVGISLVSLCDGTYTVTASAANGCSTSTTVVVGLLPACTDTNVLVINTGWNPITETKIPSNISNIDPKWTIKRPTDTDFTQVGIFAFLSQWPPTTSTSNWLYGSVPQTPGVYTYRREFKTCFSDTYTFNITQMSYDNELICIKVDDNDIYCPSPSDPLNACTFGCFVPYSFSIPLTPGPHKLDFVVNNSGGPTGLHINGNITGTVNSLVTNTSPDSCCCAPIPCDADFVLDPVYCMYNTISISSSSIGNGYFNEWDVWHSNANCSGGEGVNPEHYGNILNLQLTSSEFTPGEYYMIDHKVFYGNELLCSTSRCFYIPGPIKTVIVKCDSPSYTWDKNGVTYNTSGLYSHTSINSSGCIIEYQLDLSFNSKTGLNFDGVNDYVSIPNHSELNLGTSNFSIEAWIKFNTTQSQVFPTIISKRTGNSDGFWIWTYLGNLYVHLGITTYAINALNLNDNICHHIAVTRNGTLIDVYIDNMLTPARSFSNGSNINSPGPINLGRDPFLLNNTFMKGSIDEVRIWNYARTNLQLQAASNCNIKPQNGLVAYYKFEEGKVGQNNTSVTQVIDNTYHGNNGTFQNMALNGNTSNYVVGCVECCSYTSEIIYVDFCTNYYWPLTGLTYTASGIYTNLNDTLNLTIYPASPITTNVTLACNGYIWAANGVTYTVAGVYTHTFQNENGCQSTSTLNLTIAPAAFNVTLFEDQPISCNGNQDGIVQASVAGTGNYIYTISNPTLPGATNSTGLFANLEPGIHTVAVVNNTAPYDTVYNMINLQQPAPLSIFMYVDTLPVCMGTSGAINALIFGGTNSLQPYLTLWTNSAGDTLNDLITNNFATSVGSLGAGTYYLSIEDDHGCIASDSLELLASTESISSVTSCNSYTWSVNGSTYTASGIYTSSLLNTNGCLNTSILYLIISPCSNTLNLNLIIQGYWDGVSEMLPVLLNQGQPHTATECDFITVELHDVTSPYATAYTTTAMLNTNGTATATFASAITGDYYIVIKHRNALQTWSSNPQTFPLTTSYNFSSAATQAFGSNQVEVASGVWALYSGDSEEDENMDLLDLALVEIDMSEFVFGYNYDVLNANYPGVITTDITGDGNVDLLDAPVVEDNISNFIFSSHP